MARLCTTAASQSTGSSKGCAALLQSHPVLSQIPKEHAGSHCPPVTKNSFCPRPELMAWGQISPSPSPSSHFFLWWLCCSHRSKQVFPHTQPPHPPFRIRNIITSGAVELRTKREKPGVYLSCWLHKLKKIILWKARCCLWKRTSPAVC